MRQEVKVVKRNDLYARGYHVLAQVGAQCSPSITTPQLVPSLLSGRAMDLRRARTRRSAVHLSRAPCIATSSGISGRYRLCLWYLIVVFWAWNSAPSADLCTPHRSKSCISDNELSLLLCVLVKEQRVSPHDDVEPSDRLFWA